MRGISFIRLVGVSSDLSSESRLYRGVGSCITFFARHKLYGNLHLCKIRKMQLESLKLISDSLESVNKVK